MVVSEIGEMWSPQTAPDRQAATVMTSMVDGASPNTAIAIGIRMLNVPRRYRWQGQTERDEEEYRRHEHTDGRFRLHHRGYEAADVEVLFTADTGQRPRKRQDENSRNHCLEALGECLTELAKGQHLARDVQHKGEQQRKERAEHQRVEESQFANASTMFAPSRMPPVYSMPAMQSTISTLIGRIRS